MQNIKRKKRKFTIITLISLAVVIALAVFATIFAYELPFKWDLTGHKIFTLTESSTEVLSNLNQPVKIGAVYAEGNRDAMVTELLNRYAESSEYIELKFIDAQKNPSALSEYNIGDVQTVANGTIIVNSGNRYQLVKDSQMFYSGQTGNMFFGEREMTGAIRYVSTEKLAKAYFTTGHGENSASDMSEAISLMELDAYEVETVVLLQEDAIPEDTDVLVMASPATDINNDELQMISDYLDEGGKLMLMLDPDLGTSGDSLDNISSIMEKYGINIANNYVFEANNEYHLSNSPLYLIPRCGDHEITTQIGLEEKIVVLPVTRGLGGIDYDEDTVTRSTLLLSSAKSWARMDLTLTTDSVAPSDVQGPIALGFAASRSAGADKLSSRVVVLGDSSFMVNGNVTAQANADLFLNSVNWLLGGRDSEIIAGKVINSNTLMVRGSDFVKLAILCCGVIPILMFAGALTLWFVRRNK